MTRGNCRWLGPFWSTSREPCAWPLSIPTSRAALTHPLSPHGSTKSSKNITEREFFRLFVRFGDSRIATRRFGTCHGEEEVTTSSSTLHPVDDSLSDLIRRVLLKEVQPAHGYLCLRRPAPAELSQSPSQGESRLAVHEQLGNSAIGEPLGVGTHDLGHIGGISLKRNLARPGESGSASFTRNGKGEAIFFHLFIGQATKYGVGNNDLHKEILLQDHLFSGLRTQCLEYTTDSPVPIIPGTWSHNRLHVGNALDRSGVTIGPIEAKG